MDYNIDYFDQSVLSKGKEIGVIDRLLENYTVYELFENMSITCEDIITGCRLKGEPVANCCMEIKSYCRNSNISRLPYLPYTLYCTIFDFQWIWIWILEVHQAEKKPIM